ncbi:Hypothetical protein SRAE_1000044800 [Strongyloides ratti]|uniref:Uncharacterized protein n=1 Tax=Strongyloides ratti TaxID=34506 RepID=A0A090L3Y2_STRRB|nr:Hypothetical protein SRAE_1000044800 [Strongyloides ratti]CEF62174.1 Hypothetical protein SRAE_1000044800 [Strongyloides ratti]
MLYFCNICSSVFSDYTIFFIHTDFCISFLYEQYNRSIIGLPCNLNPKVIEPDNLQKIVKQVFAPEPYLVVDDEKIHVTQPLYIDTNFDNIKIHDNKRNNNITTVSNYDNTNYEPLLMIKPNYS